MSFTFPRTGAASAARALVPALLVWALAAPIAHAGAICKHVDANGRVSFGDCDAPATAGIPKKEVQVKAPPTGLNMATDKQRAQWRAGQQQGPVGDYLPASAAEPEAAPAGEPGNRAEEAARIAELDRACAAQRATAESAVHDRRVQDCIAGKERAEASCRSYYRNYGAPVRNANGTLNRTVPLPAVCAEADNARRNRKFN